MKILRFACVTGFFLLMAVTHAHAERTFPEQAKRGELKAYAYPEMKIGVKTYRLSPGSRIINEQNMIIMPATLQLQSAPVMYMLDMGGELAKVWLLTAEEAKRIRMAK